MWSFISLIVKRSNLEIVFLLSQDYCEFEYTSFLSNLLFALHLPLSKAFQVTFHFHRWSQMSWLAMYTRVEVNIIKAYSSKKKVIDLDSRIGKYQMCFILFTAGLHNMVFPCTLMDTIWQWNSPLDRVITLGLRCT